MPRAGARAAHRSRVHAALELVSAGASVRAVADALGVRVDRAAALIGEAVAGLPPQTVDDLRAISESRLDTLARTYGSLLRSDDERTQLAAAQGLRQVEADRVRLLGLALRPPRDEADE